MAAVPHGTTPGRGSAWGGVLRRAAAAGAGALGAQLALRAVRAAPVAAALERVNHRGATVSLAAGPALAVAAAGAAALGAGDHGARAAALTVGLSAGAVGLYDDVVGQRPDQRQAKGFRGHLAALRAGRITSGLVKIGGIGAASLAAAALADRGRGAHPADTLVSAGVIAGAANLANLFDLRPGRALKVGLLAGASLLAGPAGGLAAGPLGAAGALLPDDLHERVMLGDGGANALGALLGLAATRTLGRSGRIALLAGIAGLTLASEKVSFTAVIESHPALAAVDRWGRLPAVAAGSPDAAAPAEPRP
jgi:UDP-N-acetylmuramyl pentapeptide phosphotransferase/UDP-N-acetylglucosamine-1-phosphate transferase